VYKRQVLKNKYVIVKYIVIPLAIAVVGGCFAGCFISDSNHRFDEDKRAELKVNDSAIYFRIHSDVQGENPDRTNLHFNFNLTAKRHAVNVYKVSVYYFDKNVSEVMYTHEIDNLPWDVIPDLEDPKFIPFVKYQTHITPTMKRCLVIIYYEDYKGFREPIKCYYELNITEVDEYLFNWDNVPGEDKGALLYKLMNRDIMDGHNIIWVGDAEIRKSDDGKTIHIFKGENSAKITIDEKEEKATLNVSNGNNSGRFNLDLKVKTENGELKIYKGISSGKIFEEHYNKLQIGTYVGTSGWNG